MVKNSKNFAMLIPVLAICACSACCSLCVMGPFGGLFSGLTSLFGGAGDLVGGAGDLVGGAASGTGKGLSAAGDFVSGEGFQPKLTEYKTSDYKKPATADCNEECQQKEAFARTIAAAIQGSDKFKNQTSTI
tara:strand:+ start:392 stop:787 length:396 start_codon:yes stop_codon:yes gene_type:complete